MTKEFDFECDHWQNTMTTEDRRAMRFPSAGARLSLGELSLGPFLPCKIKESSEIFVSADHAYDLTLGKACRAAAMQAYVKYLRWAAEQVEPIPKWYEVEPVYNRVISACFCGIPQERMAKDLSNLRTYWLPRLCNKEVFVTSFGKGDESNSKREAEAIALRKQNIAERPKRLEELHRRTPRARNRTI